MSSLKLRTRKYKIVDLDYGDTSVFIGGNLIAMFYGDEFEKTGREEAEVFVDAMKQKETKQ